MQVTPGIAQLLLEQVSFQQETPIDQLPTVVKPDRSFFGVTSRYPSFLGASLDGYATRQVSPSYPGEVTDTINVQRLRALARQGHNGFVDAEAARRAGQGSLDITVER